MNCNISQNKSLDPVFLFKACLKGHYWETTALCLLFNSEDGEGKASRFAPLCNFGPFAHVYLSSSFASLSHSSGFVLFASPCSLFFSLVGEDVTRWESASPISWAMWIFSVWQRESERRRKKRWADKSCCVATSIPKVARKSRICVAPTLLLSQRIRT